MKCPYRMISEIYKKNALEKTISQEFNDCYLAQCPLWDDEIGITGGCKKVEAETSKSGYSWTAVN